MTRKNPGPSEANLQATFIEWVDLMATKVPELALFYAIPNAAKRGKMDGWVMKLTGTRRGVPDLHLPVAKQRPNGMWHFGLWIEMKSIRGVVSVDQRIWHDKLRAAGHRVEICRDVDTAIEVVKDYLGI